MNVAGVALRIGEVVEVRRGRKTVGDDRHFYGRRVAVNGGRSDIADAFGDSGELDLEPGPFYYFRDLRFRIGGPTASDRSLVLFIRTSLDYCTIRSSRTLARLVVHATLLSKRLRLVCVAASESIRASLTSRLTYFYLRYTARTR